MTVAAQGPAYRIQTARTVLRCWKPADAPLLAAAIAASVEHLRPWMPWVADEPMEFAQRVKLMRRFRAGFDRDDDGYTTCAGDCADDDPEINPKTPEIPYDGIDQNCDGLDNGFICNGMADADDVDWSQA